MLKIQQSDRYPLISILFDGFTKKLLQTCCLWLMFNMPSYAQSVQLNEIMYRPSLNNGIDPNTGEYIELRGTPGTNIGCYVLTDGDWTITIPQGTTLPADGIYSIGNDVVYGPGTLDLDAENCGCFTEGTGANALLGLTDGGEYVAFFDDMGTYIDGLMYGVPTSGNTPPNGGSSTGGVINTIGAVTCPPSVTIPSTASFLTNSGGVAAGTSLARIPDITGNWTSQAGGTLNAPNANILPVELVSFFAKVQERSVFLTWNTASESNNSHFLVQHSKDGFVFDDLARVEGKGNDQQGQFYSWVHDSPSSGINYYRLMQVDFNGSYEYSPIVSTSMESDGYAVYPNPTSGTLFITGKEGIDEGKYMVKDAFGRILQSGVLENGTVDVSLLYAGIYILELWVNETHVVKRIVKY